MKRLVILTLLLSSICFSQKKEEPQRFQIVEVENIFTAVPKEIFPYDLFLSAGVKNSFLKIDTQTGDTWLLVFERSHNIKNIDSTNNLYSAYIPKWYKIEDFNWNLPPLPSRSPKK